MYLLVSWSRKAGICWLLSCSPNTRLVGQHSPWWIMIILIAWFLTVMKRQLKNFPITSTYLVSEVLRWSLWGSRSEECLFINLPTSSGAMLALHKLPFPVYPAVQRRELDDILGTHSLHHPASSIVRCHRWSNNIHQGCWRRFLRLLVMFVLLQYHFWIPVKGGSKVYKYLSICKISLVGRGGSS